MPSPRHGLLLCFALSALLTFVVGRDVLAGGRTFVPTDLLTSRPPWAPPESDDSGVQNRLHLDIVEFFAMNAVEARRDLQAGRWPLWNSSILGGFNVSADPQVGTFYPPRAVLVGLFEPARAIDLFILLHFFFVGPAMYAFLKHRGLSDGAALFGALGWMLGGQSLVWFKYGCGLVASVFLPLLALALDRAFDGRSLRWAGGAGALWAAMFAGSHPQLSFYALVWAGLRAASAWRSIGLKPTLRIALLFGASGAAVAAVQLLPFLDLLMFSNKHVAPQPLTFARPDRTPALLLMLFWPRAFGSPVDRLDVTSSWLGGNFFEFTGYLGLLPLALAPLAGRRAAIFWVAAGLNLLLATAAPIWWILRELPVLHAMVPHRLFLFGFAGTVLGATGLDAGLRDGLQRRLLKLAAAGAGAVAVVGFFGWLRGSTWLSLASAPYAALTVAAVLSTVALLLLSLRLAPKWRAAACGAVLAADLLPFFLAYNASHAPMPPPAPAVAALPRDARILVDTPSTYWKAQFRNYASLSGHETPLGHASQYPGIYTEMTRALGAEPNALRASHRRALRALNVGWILTHEGARAVDALPRAWLAGRAEVLPGKAERLARLADPGFDLGSSVLVETPLPLLQGDSPTGSVERISAFEYLVRTERPALLVVSETWAAGWKAEILGRRSPVLRVNHAMRGVLLGPGEHAVRFLYRPSTVIAGAWITVAALVVLAGAALRGRLLSQ